MPKASHTSHGDPVGPLATIACKPRQVRKEATVASDSGAGVWLAGLPPQTSVAVSGRNRLRLVVAHPTHLQPPNKASTSDLVTEAIQPVGMVLAPIDGEHGSLHPHGYTPSNLRFRPIRMQPPGYPTGVVLVLPDRHA